MKRCDEETLDAALTRFFAAEMPAALPAPPAEEPATYAPAAAPHPWRAPAFAVALSLSAAAAVWALRPAPVAAPWSGPIVEAPADIVAPGYHSPTTLVSSRTERIGDRDLEYTVLEGAQPLGWRLVETDAGWMSEEATMRWAEVSCVLPDSGVQVTSRQPALQVRRRPLSATTLAALRKMSQ